MTILDACKYFINKAKEDNLTFTNKKLYYLGYLIQGYMLAIASEELVSDGDIVCHQEGPISKTICFGLNLFELDKFDKKPTKSEIEVLEIVYQRYASKTEYELKVLLTAENTPWAFSKKHNDKIIINHNTKTYYQSLINQIIKNNEKTK